MNDYNTAKQYLTTLRFEVLSGQKIFIEEPETNLHPSTVGDLCESLNSQLTEENKLLMEQVQKLQDELELIRGANGDVVNKLNKKIEKLKKELEKSKADISKRDNRRYVSLDSILEWASEQHKDSKDVTLIQNMIYDRFELTKKEKELVRKLDVDGLRQIIVQHADQVIAVAEKDSSVVHT